MPEELLRELSINENIQWLEDTSVSNIIRNQCYENIEKKLIDETISIPSVKKLLTICSNDMPIINAPVKALNMVSILLNKFKTQHECQCLIPELLQTAISVKEVINLAVPLKRVTALHKLCLELFLKYPDEVYNVYKNEHLLQILLAMQGYFDLGITTRDNIEVKNLVLQILNRSLKLMPPDKRKHFVEGGIQIWFSCLIPSLFYHFPSREIIVEIMELIVEDLKTIDYTYNPHWTVVLKNICTTDKYPLLLTALLNDGDEYWHRIWSILVILLKSQTTSYINNHKTPINSILPIVENAFRTVNNRCRAFQCWKVLIDNFAVETNSVYSVRRINLLAIPFKTNNAKVESTALVKFDAWWHFIKQFQSKLDSNIETIFIPFLHFCFGKSVENKSVFVPGLHFQKLKIMCAEAFVEIVGHVDCNGCVHIEKLKSSILNIKYLVDYLPDWIHALRISLSILISSPSEYSIQQIKCIWLSFLCVIVSLPGNNVRKDLFNELLSVLSYLLHKSPNSIVFNTLIYNLFDNDEMKPLLMCNDDVEVKNSPVYKVLNDNILHPHIQKIYSRIEDDSVVSKLKKIISASIDLSVKAIRLILNDLPTNDSGLVLWIIISEEFCKTTNSTVVDDHQKLLMIPINKKTKFSNVSNVNNLQAGLTTWLTLYHVVKSQHSKSSAVDKNIMSLVLKSDNTTNSEKVFTLYILPVVLASAAKRESKLFISNELQFLLSLLEGLDNCKEFISCFLEISNMLEILSDCLLDVINETVAGYTMSIASNLLRLVLQSSEVMEKQEHTSVACVVNVLKCIDKLFSVTKYMSLKTLIIDQLIACSSCDVKSFHVIILTILNKALKVTLTSETELCSSMRSSLQTAIDNVMKKIRSGPMLSIQKLDCAKIIKKVQEPDITKAKTEVTDEFVVVKANWKFNPKKLTEHQKEVLKKKREDIPALYQDLSQSQDEFVLKSWKPAATNSDSQDNSTTNSNTNSVEVGKSHTASVLNEIANPEILLNILQVNFQDNIKTETNSKNENNTKERTNANIVINNDTFAEKESQLRKTISPRLSMQERMSQSIKMLTKEHKISRNNVTVSTKSPKRVTPNKLNLNNRSPFKRSKNVNSDSCNSSTNENVSNSSMQDRPTRTIKLPQKYKKDYEVLPVKKRLHPNLSTCNIKIEENKLLNSTEEKIIEVSCQSHNNVICEISSDKNVSDDNLSNSTEIELVSKKKEVKYSDVKKQPVEDSATTTDNTFSTNSEQFPESVKENDNKPENCITVLSKDSKACCKKDLHSADLFEQSVNKNNSKNDRLSHNNAKKRTNNKQSLSTVTPLKKNRMSPKKCSSKKKSRLERELSIDMVEGHPYLPNSTKQKRMTRKSLNEMSSVSSKKLNSSLKQLITPKRPKEVMKADSEITNQIKNNDVEKSTSTFSSIEVDIDMTQNNDGNTLLIKELPQSADFIESSQDSTVSTISVKSIKSANKSVNSVNLQLKDNVDVDSKMSEHNEIEKSVDITENSINNDVSAKMDISEFNKIENNSTALESIFVVNLSLEQGKSEDISDFINPVVKGDTIALDSFKTKSQHDYAAMNSEEIACADTEPVQSLQHVYSDIRDSDKQITIDNSDIPKLDVIESLDKVSSDTLCDSPGNGMSSPFKDDAERNKDFLNNTLDISPIKVSSPLNEADTSLSPADDSNDFVVIKLSPVKSNGEPEEKLESPEIFSNDNYCIDKRDISPPRQVTNIVNNSPSSALSLKKNRTQVRQTGRAAQMLGLCVPERMEELINSSKMSEFEEIQRTNIENNSHAKRNLKALYNCNGDDESSSSEEGEVFLKFKRLTPTLGSSPYGSILKRKFSEIGDESPGSPASKRKRVSFHDPPVSTTVSVQKYIDSSDVRSPQSSHIKRQEKLSKHNTMMKSPKKLDYTIKTDTASAKTLEYYLEDNTMYTEDTAMCTEDTLSLEVIKNCDLNNTDPICPDLIECSDPISHIASELSSTSNKSLLVKEFEGQIEKIGDLAKLTELQVNRLCVKAPKVKITRKVLSDYAAKVAKEKSCDNVNQTEVKSCIDIDPQTIKITSNDLEMQTIATVLKNNYICNVCMNNTDKKLLTDTVSQTDKTGEASTEELLDSLILKQDLLEKLIETLSSDYELVVLIRKLVEIWERKKNVEK